MIRNSIKIRQAVSRKKRLATYELLLLNFETTAAINITKVLFISYNNLYITYI